MNGRSLSSVLLALFWACYLPVTGVSAQLDSFGSGSNAFEIEFVPIGDPGNVADTDGFPNPAGSVPYTYRIGKYEISEQMIDKANTLGGLGITKDTRGPDKPATSVNWIEAAKFVNWLNTSTGNSPAYKFEDISGIQPPPPNAALMGFALWEPGDAGYDPNNLFRNRLARYVLPSADEWYKAAYFDPASATWQDFPTEDGTPPTPVLSGTDPNTAVFLQGAPFPTGPADIMQAGGLNPYGTMAQGGNAYEWLETESDLVNDDTFSRRGRRGGFWDTTLSGLSRTNLVDALPTSSRSSTGFRVASIPEPSTLLLFSLGTLCLHGLGRRNRILRAT